MDHESGGVACKSKKKNDHVANGQPNKTKNGKNT